MAEQLRLKAFGRVDLDGTHRAVIEAEREIEPFKREGGPPPLLQLEGDDRTCGCMLSELLVSSENRIFLDRYKMRHLGLKDGEFVTVRETRPQNAKKIELSVPSDYTERDFIRFIGKPFVSGESTALFNFSGEARGFIVANTEPKGLVLVATTTRIEVCHEKPGEVSVSWDDIGGFRREIERIREIAEYPFRFPELFRHLGVSPPKGIILHGPPGTGKTLIAKALAAETGARFYSVSGPEVYSKWYGKTEEALRNVFEEAVKNAPAVVVIDELDALVPRREKTHGDQEQRIVATFLTQMDGLKQLKDVVVVGTTNRIDAIDPALRRGGRFECEIHIGVPDVAGREAILSIHTRGMPLHSDVDLEELSSKLGGYVGADIASICREAAYNALRRSFSKEMFERDEVVVNDELRVRQADFKQALGTVSPSGGREFLAEVPPVSWDDIGGLGETKRLLVENITYAINRREAFEKVGVKPASGILLFGPPGTGKTLLARAVAKECGANFIAVKGSTLRSRWLGEAEERVRSLFAKARLIAPCVVFLDEIDSVVPGRGREMNGSVDSIVNQILAEMDGIESRADVYVIGATNRIELLDPAVLRPGRFDYHVEIPLPDARAREEIFEVHLRDKPLDSGIDLLRLAESTEGFSGAEIAEVCRDGAWRALREADFNPEDVRVRFVEIQKSIEKIRKMRRDLGEHQ